MLGLDCISLTMLLSLVADGYGIQVRNLSITLGIPLSQMILEMKTAHTISERIGGFLTCGMICLTMLK